MLAGRRTARARGRADPAPELFAPPPEHRRLSWWDRPVPAIPTTGSSPSWSSWWWLGAHGGAGATSLERVSRAQGSPWGRDAFRRWPNPTYESSPLVVVVCRSHATGLEWARDLARQHASGLTPPGTRPLGLVVLADAPGSLPRRLRDFERSVVGGYERAWYVPWMTEWRLTGIEEELAEPPEVRGLLAELRTAASAELSR